MVRKAKNPPSFSRALIGLDSILECAEEQILRLVAKAGNFLDMLPIETHKGILTVCNFNLR